MPWPVLADTGTNGESPPYSSGTTCSATSSCFTRSEVGLGLVDLVDRDDDRHAGRLRVVDGFLGLRHHAVVGGDHQDDDVGRLGAARAHGGERLVARGVEEGDHAARRLDVVGADVLRDAAGFARRHLGAADVVQQRGLAVVDVAHDGDDRGARQRLGFCAATSSSEERSGIVQLGGHRLVAHFLDDDHRRVLVELLVDGDHLAHLHQRLDHLGGLDRHLVRQLGDRDGLRHVHFDDRCSTGADLAAWSPRSPWSAARRAAAAPRLRPPPPTRRRGS